MTTPNPLREKVARIVDTRAFYFRNHYIEGSEPWAEAQQEWNDALSRADAILALLSGDGWEPIETAPKDGCWFMNARFSGGPEEYEIGRYEPQMWARYVDAGNGLYRKEDEQIGEWRGFNNMHRATHWRPLPAPPAACISTPGEQGDGEGR